MTSRARTAPPRTPPPRIRWFKALRIALLLIVLLVVALTTWQDRYRSTRWRDPLFVAIHPIVADASPVTRSYVESLDDRSFTAIDRFFAREAGRYHVPAVEPVRTRRKRELKELPPQHPAENGLFATALWSLKLRYFAWTVNRGATEPEDVRMFVLYHDPALTPTVPNSIGLTKGLICVVYAFASPLMQGANDIVIAHELLHTVGATDKYDRTDDAPRFPDGYGDPQQRPLYPQLSEELMAGRRMLSADRWQQASSLDEVVIGPATALEIRWLQSSRGGP